jgi:preprotein translocase subunit SecY
VYFAFSNLEQSAFLSESKLFLWTTVFSLLGSTMLLTWLGDKITHQGIGNGISVLIFTGIVSELPANISGILEASRKAEFSYLFFVLLTILAVSLIFFVVYMEKAVRNVKIQYSTNRGLITNQKDVSYIPMKINVSGVIPPIFASSILAFPLIIVQFFGKDETVSKLSGLLSRGGLLYTALFSICIIFFSFFYSTIVFNTEELSENLKKGNCFVPGIRPGNSTKEFFDKILSRLTFMGAIYLFVVCIIPDILFTKYSINLTIGGTSLLIIVSTVIDIVNHIQSYVLSDKYGNVNKRRRIKVN